MSKKEKDLYIVNHEHRHGVSTHYFYSSKPIEEEDVIPHLEDFEPDREEYIEIFKFDRAEAIDLDLVKQEQS